MTTTRKPLADGRKAGWAFMDRFEVPDYDTPDAYLIRWRLIETPLFGIYLHRFNLPDPRPTLHDHPWAFVSIVLRGGYEESVAYGRAPRTVRHVNVKRLGAVHSIRRLLRAPTWTLMLVGRRQRVWGYLDPDGTWTPFDEHRHDAEFKAALARRKASRA